MTTSKPTPEEFLEAIKASDTARVEALLEQGANPDTADEKKNTALMYAVRLDKPEIAKLLLNHGADPNLCGPYQTTALMYAARNNKPALAELLLDHGAELDVKDTYYNFTPLMYAAWHAKWNGAEVVGLLIDKGADLDVKGNNGKTVLEQAQSYPTEISDEACKLLKTAKVRQKQLRNEKASPGEFVKAVSEYDPHSDPDGRYGSTIDLIKILLDLDPAVNEKDADGNTPLHLALQNDGTSCELISLLINNGADLEATNKAGDTPLMCAATYDNIPALNLLIEKGVSLDRKNLSGQDALHFANNGFVYWIGHGYIPRNVIKNAPPSEAVEIIMKARQQQAEEKAAREAAVAEQKRIEALTGTAARKQAALNKNLQKIIPRP